MWTNVLPPRVTFSVVSELDPADGVGAADPVVVGHNHLQGHPLDNIQLTTGAKDRSV